MLMLCPCCHGQGYLLAHDAGWPDDPPCRSPCSHCAGSGKVKTELREMAAKEANF
jgi:DnaJ-class molecular chaperone